MGSPAQRWWRWLVRPAQSLWMVNMIHRNHLFHGYLSVGQIRVFCYFIFCFTYRGEVMNGGFGLLLDGSEEAAKRASLMLNWDVSNGVRVQREKQRHVLKLQNIIARL